MKYVKETISPEDREKILREIDESKRVQLQARAGHFNNEPDLPWAIDKERNNYLFAAPNPSMSPDKNYFMRFNEKTYSLRILNRYGPEVSIDDPVDKDLLPLLEVELTAAFELLGNLGRKFSPVFAKKEI